MNNLKLNRRAFVGGLLGSAVVLSRPMAFLAATNEAVPGEDLTPLLTPVLEDCELPAIAAGAVKEGKLLGVGAVGLRMVGASEKVRWDDKFHIGSCTKAMTSTLAAAAVERGQLKWDSTVAKLFPERAGKMDPAFRTATLEMLLTHRTGLPHDGTYYGRARSPVSEQRLAYMEAVLAKPPPHQPDTFSYSNAGYIIAGAMLERVTGKTWEELMRADLFKPLGMSSAGFGVAATRRQADQPWGHIWREGKFVPRHGDNHPALGPAGTVHCSIPDYLKFASLHASLGTRPAGIISKTSCEKLHQRAKEHYALGWGVCERSWARGVALTHAGSNTLNYFVVWMAPKIDFAMAVASNAAGDKAPGLLDRVAGLLVKKFCV